MKEDFLHYVWKFQKFPHATLWTVQAKRLQVIREGFHNQNEGPDFLNAELVIGDLRWVGSVELHLKSSDWYRHRHQQNKAYDNVILHVVWEDDIAVFNADGSRLPTLVLSDLVPKSLLDYYKETFLKTTDFIPCQAHFKQFPSPLFSLWKEGLFVERLEVKSKRIQQLLKEYKNDWEAVLFCLLARNFGLNSNGAAFFALAQNIPFKVIRKLQHDVSLLEALFLGMAGLLSLERSTAYENMLWKEYQYIKHKFSLSAPAVSVRFMRLRPQNFPTIRLAQLASLYASSQQLFAQIFDGATLKTQWMNTIAVSSFWTTHYTFGKSAKNSKEKRLSPTFIDLLKVNTFIPLYYCYQKARGQDPTAYIFTLMQEIKAEQNTIVKGFEALGGEVDTALDSQAFLQLKKTYCQLKKCLLCRVGVHLLNHNT